MDAAQRQARKLDVAELIPPPRFETVNQDLRGPPFFFKKKIHFTTLNYDHGLIFNLQL